MVHFDGGLHKVGFVVHGVDSTLLHAFGDYDMVTYSTNNVAEMMAGTLAVRFLASTTGLELLAGQTTARYISIRGDSQLIIHFLNKTNTACKPLFYNCIDEIQALRCTLLLPV